MSADLQAEVAAMHAAMERAVHMLGCGDVEAARRLLSAHLAGLNAGREWLRAHERNTERAEKSLREYLAPLVAAWERGETPGG